MENLIAFLVISIAYTQKRLPLAKVVFCFYLMFFCLYLFDYHLGLDWLTWFFVNIVIDLIILALCYNAFIRGSVIALVYMLWVIVGYILPELLSLNEIVVSWNESDLMCVVDVLFVMSEFINAPDYSGDNKRDSFAFSNRRGRHSDSEEKE